MSIFYYSLLWFHLISMASLVGLLISCKVLLSDQNSVLKLAKYCRTFFGLLFVSGFLLIYLKITLAMRNGISLNTGFYHIILTKFVLLLGLGHFVFLGSQKNHRFWVHISLVLSIIASMLGICLRNY